MAVLGLEVLHARGRLVQEPLDERARQRLDPRLVGAPTPSAPRSRPAAARPARRRARAARSASAGRRAARASARTPGSRPRRSPRRGAPPRGAPSGARGPTPAAPSMSTSVTPSTPAHAGSMSRGTARSTSSSGRRSRASITASSSSAPMIACGEAVEETTTSARSSSPGQRVERARRAAELRRQRDRAVAPPVRDEHRRHAVRVEGARGLLGRVAGADDHDVPPLQPAERGAGGVDRHRRHRRVTLGDRRLRAHALAGRQRRAEQPVGQRPGRARRQRPLVRALDLALDLGLADDHRLQPARRPGTGAARRRSCARRTAPGSRRPSAATAAASGSAPTT